MRPASPFLGGPGTASSRVCDGGGSASRCWKIPHVGFLRENFPAGLRDFFPAKNPQCGGYCGFSAGFFSRRPAGQFSRRKWGLREHGPPSLRVFCGCVCRAVGSATEARSSDYLVHRAAPWVCCAQCVCIPGGGLADWRGGGWQGGLWRVRGGWEVTCTEMDSTLETGPSKFSDPQAGSPGPSPRLAPFHKVCIMVSLCTYREGRGGGAQQRMEVGRGREAEVANTASNTAYAVALKQMRGGGGTPQTHTCTHNGAKALACVQPSGT